MQLTYRGLTYTPANPTLKTAATGAIATFRGARYCLQRPESLPPQPRANLVYRGVGYTRGGGAATEPVVAGSSLAPALS